MFHSLDNRRIQQYQHEIPCSARENLRGRYERLKSSPFRDAASEQWKMSAMPPDCPISEQLLGVLVENHFSKEGARACIEKLKQSDHWSKSRAEWESSAVTIAHYLKDISKAHVGLLDVITTMLVGDRAAAKRRWDALIASPLWDPELKRWRHIYHQSDRHHPEPIGTIASRRSADQLAGIFAANLFEPGCAEARFYALRETPFWERDRKGWLRDDREPDKGTFQTYVQLWGVLVQALFDPIDAHYELKRLKQTPAWDPLDAEWNRDMSGGGPRQTEDQLLGLLVELAFAEPGDIPRSSASTALPLQRSF